MNRCDRCGEAFDSPDTRRVTEWIDSEHLWTHDDPVCPACGCEDFSRAPEPIEEEEEEE